MLLGAFTFLLFTVGCLLGSFNYVQQQKAIDGGVIVEATIVDVERDSERSSTWRECYEYIDDDGVRYSGRGKSGIKSEAEARAHIGTKIKIYIDGKGNSVPVGRNPDYKATLILGVFFFILTIILVVLFFKWRFKEKSDALKVEEERVIINESSFLADLRQLDAVQEESEDFQKDERNDFS